MGNLVARGRRGKDIGEGICTCDSHVHFAELQFAVNTSALEHFPKTVAALDFEVLAAGVENHAKRALVESLRGKNLGTANLGTVGGLKFV